MASKWLRSGLFASRNWLSIELEAFGGGLAGLPKGGWPFAQPALGASLQGLAGAGADRRRGLGPILSSLQLEDLRTYNLYIESIYI